MRSLIASAALCLLSCESDKPAAHEASRPAQEAPPASAEAQPQAPAASVRPIGGTKANFWCVPAPALTQKLNSMLPVDTSVCFPTLKECQETGAGGCAGERRVTCFEYGYDLGDGNYERRDRFCVTRYCDAIRREIVADMHKRASPEDLAKLVVTPCEWTR
jgi:hypothetical protein